LRRKKQKGVTREVRLNEPPYLRYELHHAERRGTDRKKKNPDQRREKKRAREKNEGKKTKSRILAAVFHPPRNQVTLIENEEREQYAGNPTPAEKIC